MMALEAQTVLVWGAVACALAGLILFALWFHNHWQQRQQAPRVRMSCSRSRAIVSA